MAERYPFDCTITEEAVDALDDLRFDRLDHWRKGPGDDDTQRSAATFALRESQPFGCAVLGILVADNFAPSCNNGTLLEAETPERGGADIGHQLADGARAARPWLGDGI